MTPPEQPPVRVTYRGVVVPQYPYSPHSIDLHEQAICDIGQEWDYFKAGVDAALRGEKP